MLTLISVAEFLCSNHDSSFPNKEKEKFDSLQDAKELGNWNMVIFDLLKAQ